MAEQKGAPARDIEKEIHELEERVDRLRVLYEQYFLGFEKLEPSVPRKEVDRRFAILRKENIRNTALRYRFNVVTQKYNTYAMHWTRICRQIEEGTFKRHVKKAQERFGDVASARARRDREAADAAFDVDIDFEDLDSASMDDVLADAERAASKYERGTIDTVPPAVASAPPPSAAPRAASASTSIDRVARPAPLPATGSKPKLIRKIVKSPDAAGSSPHASPPPDSNPTPPPAARPAPSPSGSIRGPMPAAPPAPSAGRMPVASPSTRVAITSPSSSPSTRVPIAAPTPPPSDRGIGAPAPSERRMPAPPPARAPGVPASPHSERRMPVPSAPTTSPGIGAPSERRMPAPAPTSAPGLPAGAPSERRMPAPAAAPGGGARPMIRPAIRPATQSSPDLGQAAGGERPSRPNPTVPGAAPPPAKPRLPLPSQIDRDEKK